MVTDIYGISCKGCCISKTDYQLKTRDTRELASATFFAPYDKTVEPYIRIATGDYEVLVSERGKNHALWAILRSMAHEIRKWMRKKQKTHGKNY